MAFKRLSMRLLGFLVLLLFYPHAIADPQIVRLAGIEMAPYSGSDLPNNGLVVDIVRQAYQQVGWEIDIEFYPIARASRLLASDEIDGYLLATLNFPAKNTLYSDPIVEGEIAFFSHKSVNLAYTSPEDLVGLSVGAMNGWGGDGLFPELNWQKVSTPLQMFKMLSTGRISAFLYEAKAFSYLLNSYYPEQVDQFVKLEPIITPITYGVAFSMSDPKGQGFVDALNLGMKMLESNGSLAEIRHSLVTEF